MQANLEDKTISESEFKLLSFLENSQIFNSLKVKTIIEDAKKLNCSPLDLFDQENLINILSELLGFSKANNNLNLIDSELIKLVPSEFALNNICIPLSITKKSLVIAIFNPFQSNTIIDLERITGFSVKTVLATKKDIINAIKVNYPINNEINKSINIFGLDNLVNHEVEDITETEIKISEGNNNHDLLELSYDDTPVVKMVNFVISQAIKEKSSDIHIEAGQNYLLVRNRVDGVLHEMLHLQKWIQNAFISRIKVISKLDITEKRIPQDGKIKLKYEGKDIDIRVSTLPTNFGESVVLRILNSSDEETLIIDKLGFSSENLASLKTAIHEPHGIILVTGPTGSGKSSTLYSCLKEVNSPERNIITVEDPVEFTMEGVNQVQVNNKAGLNFASALRAILRQDPNIIMIGEIRDPETAEIAFNASMTGHLVLSTLHTNDSVASIARLVDMGIPGFLISSSLLMIIAQRLVRKVCPDCSEEYSPDKDILQKFSITEKNIKYQRGKGCMACKNTGYRGRIGIYEVLNIDEDIKKLIKMDTASEQEIINFLKKKEMKFLLDDALDKIKKGLTTFEEVIRVLGTAHLKF